MPLRVCDVFGAWCFSRLMALGAGKCDCASDCAEVAFAVAVHETDVDVNEFCTFGAKGT